MLSKKKIKLNESPEINLIWADDEVQLLLESVRNFKTQKSGEGIDWESVKEKYKRVYGDELTSPYPIVNIPIALQKVQSKKLSSKNYKYTYNDSLLPISLLQRPSVQFFLYCIHTYVIFADWIDFIRFISIR